MRVNEGLYAVTFANGLVHVGYSLNTIVRWRVLQRDGKNKQVPLQSFFFIQQPAARLPELLQFCRDHGKATPAHSYFTHLPLAQVVDFLMRPPV